MVTRSQGLVNPKYKAKQSLSQNAFKYKEMTLNEFYNYIQDNNVDASPIGQRNDVQRSDLGGATPSKAQGIVESIFQGLDIGEISLAGIKRKEVLEGGHRTRKAVIAFRRNEFPLHKTSMFGEKKYSELPDYAKEYFRNYKLRIVDFYELEGTGIGKQFVQFATNTSLNFVEKVNSYGLVKSILKLREYTRVVDYGKGVIDNKLSFFKNYVGFTNGRLKFLEVVLESVGLQYSKSTVTNEQMIVDYLDTAKPSKIKIIENAIAKEYKFYSDVASFWSQYKGSKMGLAEFGLVRHIYHSLPKSFKIVDYDKWTGMLISNYNDFVKKYSDVDYVDENGDRLDGRYAKVSDAFHSYIKKVDNATATEQVREWLEEITPLVVVKDTVRCFSKKDLLKRYQEVDGVCEIDGEPIHFNDVVGAHIIPHGDGGKTEYSNLMITTKYHNEKMGTMNALEYKKVQKKQ